ncbi:MAG TPA: glutaredoxin domain-containing protein [Patescibacteria group bacterium]|nr:glutaredoxin domain-containing protein [Patescibacteria group bacterium]
MSITIYSTPTCPYCQMAKDYFDAHHMIYLDSTVADNEKNAQEMIQKSGQMGVPVIIISPEQSVSKKEEVIIGFDQQKVARVLGINE